VELREAVLNAKDEVLHLREENQSLRGEAAIPVGLARACARVVSAWSSPRTYPARD
jgi:hypothetical protein